MVVKSADSTMLVFFFSASLKSLLTSAFGWLLARWPKDSVFFDAIVTGSGVTQECILLGEPVVKF